MLPSAIRAALFDAVGTVMVPDPPAAIVYVDTARRYGIAVSSTEVSVRFRAALRGEDEIDRALGWVTSEARERLRWQRVVTEVLPDAPAECFEELFLHFSNPGAWNVPAEVPSVLAALSGRGLRLGLASNYDARLRSVLAGFPALRPLADRVVVSSEVGWRKPSREFFAAVAEAVGEPPNRIAFVGDDKPNDYDGADAAGMFAVLLDPDDAFPNVANRIRTLSDLLV